MAGESNQRGSLTFSQLIAGWLESNSTVALHGNPTGRVQPLRDRGVGMVYQDDLLFPHLDVLENAQFAINYPAAFGAAANSLTVITDDLQIPANVDIYGAD